MDGCRIVFLNFIIFGLFVVQILSKQGMLGFFFFFFFQTVKVNFVLLWMLNLPFTIASIIVITMTVYNCAELCLQELYTQNVVKTMIVWRNTITLNVLNKKIILPCACVKKVLSRMDRKLNVTRVKKKSIFNYCNIHVEKYRYISQILIVQFNFQSHQCIAIPVSKALSARNSWVSVDFAAKDLASVKMAITTGVENATKRAVKNESSCVQIFIINMESWLFDFSSGLNEDCDKNEDCFVHASFQAVTCKNKKCQCSDGYYQREYSTCRKNGNYLCTTFP